MAICNYGVNKLNHLKLEVVIFGSDDYLASIGNYNHIILDYVCLVDLTLFRWTKN